MTVSKPKAKAEAPGARKPIVDLVLDDGSESFLFIKEAACKGRRVSTRGLSDDRVRALLLGDRRGE